jgi:heme a synthase
MNVISEKDKRLLVTWLWLGVLLVVFMVMVGGITRLTGSGLSIVKWKIITGTLPPLSSAEWEQVFQEYKQTPQFNQINHSFTVEDFKGIFWWEYFHRLAGRLIGLIFIIPYLIIIVKRKLPKSLIRQLTIIFVLGLLQGIMGWIMVKSGLTDLPYVNHYRLAMHLSLALLLIGAILWTILKIDLGSGEQLSAQVQQPYLFYVAAMCLVIQIILGAFVAGLKAGFYYNTFPLMGETLVPENTFVSIHNGVFIQFLHRWFAFLVAVFVFLVWMKYRKDNKAIAWSVNVLMIGILIQVLLGVLTLIFRVPLFLGVLHQLVAVGLFAVSIKMLFHLVNVVKTT